MNWPGAGLGPAGYDLGWCPVDLYLLDGEAAADAFLAAYEAAAGVAVPGPRLWDLRAAARSAGRPRGRMVAPITAAAVVVVFSLLPAAGARRRGERDGNRFGA